MKLQKTKLFTEFHLGSELGQKEIDILETHRNDLQQDYETRSYKSEIATEIQGFEYALRIIGYEFK